MRLPHNKSVNLTPKCCALGSSPALGSGAGYFQR